MTCDYYSVLYGELVLAQHMTLETAMLLVEAMFQKFWAEGNLSYTIKKEETENETVLHET